MFSGDLQVLVDDLAERLGRSATIEDESSASCRAPTRC
jgi:hypothetical protein